MLHQRHPLLMSLDEDPVTNTAEFSSTDIDANHFLFSSVPCLHLWFLINGKMVVNPAGNIGGWFAWGFRTILIISFCSSKTSILTLNYICYKSMWYIIKYIQFSNFLILILYFLQSFPQKATKIKCLSHQLLIIWQIHQNGIFNNGSLLQNSCRAFLQDYLLSHLLFPSSGKRFLKNFFTAN